MSARHILMRGMVLLPILAEEMVRVIAVDNDPEHLQLAKEHGADNPLPSGTTTARNKCGVSRPALGRRSSSIAWERRPR